MEIKSPPYDLELETAILGACVLFSNSIDTAADICTQCKVEDFYKPDHKIIFKAFKELVAQNIIPDIEIVFRAIRNKIHSLDNWLAVTSVFSDSNYKHAIKDLKKLSQLRKIILVSQNVIGSAYEQESPENLISKIESELFQLSENESFTARPFMEYANRVIKDFDKYSKSEYQLGIKSIDKRLMWHRGEYYILGGQPGAGKSSFEIFCMETIAKQEPVLFFSQEMSGEKVAYRAAIGRGKYFDGVEKFKLGIKDFEGLPIYIDPTPALTLFEMRSKLMRYIKRFGIKFVGLDYIQLAEGTGDNETARITSLSKGIMALAKETDTTWLVISQLNTEGYSGRPTKANLRGSRQLAQDARGIYFLYQDPDDRGTDIVNFYCDKQNNGEAGWDVRLFFNRAANRLGELAPENTGY